MTLPIARVVDGRRQNVDRMQASSGGAFDHEGHVDLHGTGEAIFDLAFPYRFTERPVFTAGYSLDDNQSYVTGSLPDWSATVLKWTFGSSTGGRFYDGAIVCWVITGLAGQIGVGHFRFSGKALVGPAGR